MSPVGGDRPVVVVTGGGGGIGAAMATELGRQGAFVVTVDPLVTVDGTGTVPAPEQTTADRIAAAGGEARASSASVTDASAVHALFADLVAERGRLDGVVNVAGITRPTGFAKGSEVDWEAVLSVHLDGYLNVLSAALPIMAAAGRGQILGVTSGSGWRAADAGAYSQAKRAVASLTWELGRSAPPGVSVNAISPIAMTRMVTAALARGGSAPPSGSADSAGSAADPGSATSSEAVPATTTPSTSAEASPTPPASATSAASTSPGATTSTPTPESTSTASAGAAPVPAVGGAAGAGRPAAATGGLSLSSMPYPDDLGPLGAALVGPALAGLRGQVLFAGGSEVAVVDPPRLLEVVRSDGVGSLAHVIGAVEGSFVEAEAAQATSGGSNPRFSGLFTEEDQPATIEPSGGSNRTDAEADAEVEPGSADTRAGRAAGGTVLAAVVVTDETAMGREVAERLRAADMAVEVVPADSVTPGFAPAREALDRAAGALDGADAVVLALSAHGGDDASHGEGWESILAGHADLVAELRTDAAWSRAAADHAEATGRALRLVTVVDASDAGGRSRAQAAAQLARASRRATRDAVSAFAVSVEDRSEVSSTAELVAHLLSSAAAPELAGAELVVGQGWIGLRSHPRPGSSVVYGGPELPHWFGTALRMCTDP